MLHERGIRGYRATASSLRWRIVPLLCLSIPVSVLFPGWGRKFLGLPQQPGSTYEYHLLSPQVLLAVTVLTQWNVIIPPVLVLALLSVSLLIGVWRAIQESAEALSHPDAVLQKVRDWTRVFLAGLFILLWAGWAFFQAFQTVRILQAPDSSPLIASGTLLYGVAVDVGNQPIRRGQLVFVDVDHSPSLVRVLAVPGDIFGQSPNKLHINGGEIIVRLMERNGTAQHDLRALAQRLNALTDVRSEREGSGLILPTSLKGAMARLPDDSIVLGEGMFVVAKDSDLLQTDAALLPVEIISLDRWQKVILPWAKFWGFDQPGRTSDLAQPAIAFGD